MFLHQTHKGDFKEGDQVAFMAVVRNGKVQAKDLEPAPPGSDTGMSPMGMGGPMGGPGPMAGAMGPMGGPMGDMMGPGCMACGPGGCKGGAVVVDSSLDRSARTILRGIDRRSLRQPCNAPFELLAPCSIAGVELQPFTPAMRTSLKARPARIAC